VWLQQICNTGSLFCCILQIQGPLFSWKSFLWHVSHYHKPVILSCGEPHIIDALHKKKCISIEDSRFLSVPSGTVLHMGYYSIKIWGPSFKLLSAFCLFTKRQSLFSDIVQMMFPFQLQCYVMKSHEYVSRHKISLISCRIYFIIRKPKLTWHVLFQLSLYWKPKLNPYYPWFIFFCTLKTSRS